MVANDTQVGNTLQKDRRYFAVVRRSGRQQPLVYDLGKGR
jgi:hypothetical protein